MRKITALGGACVAALFFTQSAIGQEARREGIVPLAPRPHPAPMRPEGVQPTRFAPMKDQSANVGDPALMKVIDKQSALIASLRQRIADLEDQLAELKHPSNP